MSTKLYSQEMLQDFIKDVLTTYQMPSEDAAIVAKVLVYADLLGFDSHGIIHLAEHFAYVPGIETGMVNARPNIKVEQPTPAIVTVDGDRAMGMVAFQRGMEQALEAAKTLGLGLAVVRNSFHAGALSYYTREIAMQGLIGLAFTNTGAIVAPPLGKQAAVGSNPISIAAPYLPKRPLLLDMAISVVAGGKIEIARRQGQSVPEGWIIDHEGQKTVDPQRFFEQGALLPLGSTPEMGGYKGFGLGVMIDVLTGILTGMGHSLTLGSTGGQAHTMIIIDPKYILNIDDFSAGISKMVDDLHAIPTVDGSNIMVPGEREWKTYLQRSEQGIPLNQQVMQSLQELAEKRGLTPYSRQFI